jgi:hypothetical protein
VRVVVLDETGSHRWSKVVERDGHPFVQERGRRSHLVRRKVVVGRGHKQQCLGGAGKAEERFKEYLR